MNLGRGRREAGAVPSIEGKSRTSPLPLFTTNGKSEIDAGRPSRLESRRRVKITRRHFHLSQRLPPPPPPLRFLTRRQKKARRFARHSPEVER